MVWLLLNILPVILLSISALLFTLRSKCAATCFANPGMILSAVFSHFHVGPVHFSKTNSVFISRSPLLTFLNILITFLGMCLSIHLTQQGWPRRWSSSSLHPPCFHPRPSIPHIFN